jgi:hypothetical protein
MNAQPVTDVQLKAMLNNGWQSVGFQPTMSPGDFGEAGAADGYAILLQNGKDLSILHVDYNNNDQTWSMSIIALTGAPIA